MRQRYCAGGVVFSGDDVFLLRNEKGEWVLPKGVIREGQKASDIAIDRVQYEAGLRAKILAPAGETCYEFFSVSRRAPISNRIDWFIMQALDTEFQINKEEGFTEGGFYPHSDAVEKITYSQDRALVNLAHEKYLAILRE